MKKIFLIVLFLLSTIVNSGSSVASTPYTNLKSISSISSINSNWVLIKKWTLTNNQCSGCTSLWYSMYRSSFRDENGYYTFLVYFQSASLWNNGANARTEYTDLDFIYDNRVFHSSKWGIIGYTEDTQQVFTLRMGNGNPQTRFRFEFSNIKHN